MTRQISFWDKLAVWFVGNKLAVLGEREVGKTHLITFLTSGTIPGQYRQTMVSTKYNMTRFFANDQYSPNKVRLNIKAGSDVPGWKERIASWQDLVRKADIVLYLLRIDKLVNYDKYHEERILHDADLIAEWLQKRTRPKFVIIGTHCDLDPSYPSRSHEPKFSRYYVKIMDLPAIKRVQAKFGEAFSELPEIIIGDMKTLENTEDLVYRVFNFIQET